MLLTHTIHKVLPLVMLLESRRDACLSLFHAFWSVRQQTGARGSAYYVERDTVYIDVFSKTRGARESTIILTCLQGRRGLGFGEFNKSVIDIFGSEGDARGPNNWPSSPSLIFQILRCNGFGLQPLHPCSQLPNENFWRYLCPYVSTIGEAAPMSKICPPCWGTGFSFFFWMGSIDTMK